MRSRIERIERRLSRAPVEPKPMNYFWETAAEKNGGKLPRDFPGPWPLFPDDPVVPGWAHTEIYGLKPGESPYPGE